MRRSVTTEGFITGFTAEALSRCLHFKRRRKLTEKGGAEWLWYEERQTTLKEMLFVVYGYSGCFANRFGNVETYMEINRQAREALVRSMNVARSRGFRSLYGNNDSLFPVKRGATRGDYEELTTEIGGATGLPMAVDSVYRFLALLARRGDEGMAAVNRYVGVTFEGELNCRGIELRRRDTPRFVSETQRRAMGTLLGYGTRGEVESLGVEAASAVVEEACRGLRAGEVPEEDLRVETRLRSAPGEYRRRGDHVSATEALAINRTPRRTGGLTPFLYADAGNPNRFRRVRPGEYGGRVDVGKYEEMVRCAGGTLLAPFLRRAKVTV